jgi:hypothetical protein
MPIEETPLSVKDFLANQNQRKGLEAHVDGLQRGQDIVTQSKPGQVLAEKAVLGPNGELPVDGEARSRVLMGLADLIKYDNASHEDVVNLANAGTDLNSAQMWHVVAGNARFMDNIKPGLTINKILPDEAIGNVLAHKQTFVDKDPRTGAVRFAGTALAGSVADERYYEKLTGEQAIANFGLDYGGYSPGTLKADTVTPAQGGNHSSYVVDAQPDSQGRALAAVPNVFYIKAPVPDSSLDQVKVPVHANVANWAKGKLDEINATLADDQAIKSLAQQAGGTEEEMRAKLAEKKAMLETFNANSKVDNGMTTTVRSNGAGGFVKNTEDPLTNLGMTKPGDRLQSDFSTINQEYHIENRFNVPPGARLYLKDATGKDQEVGQLINHNGRVEFGNLNTEVINAKLDENRNFRLAEAARAKLKPVEQNVQPKVEPPAEFQTIKLKPAPQNNQSKVEPLAEFQTIKLKPVSVRDQLGKRPETPKVEGIKPTGPRL